MPGTFSPPPRVSDPDMHHGTCVTHVPWCMPESLTSGFLWSWWRGKRSRHSRSMRNTQFHVSSKRPILECSFFNAILVHILAKWISENRKIVIIISLCNCVLLFCIIAFTAPVVWIIIRKSRTMPSWCAPECYYNRLWRYIRVQRFEY